MPGKTSLLDKIRGTAVAEREAGGISQHIGATEIPIEVIKKICGPLIDQLKAKITIPGLLFIDTPGHRAFVNLRRRGGALADLAILVVDVTAGFQSQTIEAISILKRYKTPFIVAANKIDLIYKWRFFETTSFLESFKKQESEVQEYLDKKIYEMVGKLYEQGFNSERFDRVKDFTKQLAIVPVSAKTGEGIPELLMMLTGLAQQFLEQQLKIEVAEPGKATVLEVKEEVGLGKTIDTILYDGTIRKGETIIIGGLKEPIITKVRSILKPQPLDEIRDPRFKFKSVNEVQAAAGIKISAPNLDNAIAGAPLRIVREESKIENFKQEVQKEIEEVRIETNINGVILKADAIGSLEALVNELKELSIPIRIADVGDVSKRDIVEAQTVKEIDTIKGTVLAFNVKILPDAKVESERLDVPILVGDVIYKLVEDYQKWAEETKKEMIRKQLKAIVRPAKIKLLPGFVFHVSKPAIVGIEVLAGAIKPGYKLLRKDGYLVGELKSIQDKGQSLKEASMGQKIAIAIEGPTVGRQIKEGDVLYTDVLPRHIDIIEEKLKDVLTPEEIQTLQEIKEIRKLIEAKK